VSTRTVPHAHGSHSDARRAHGTRTRAVTPADAPSHAEISAIPILAHPPESALPGRAHWPAYESAQTGAIPLTALPSRTARCSLADRAHTMRRAAESRTITHLACRRCPVGTTLCQYIVLAPLSCPQYIVTSVGPHPLAHKQSARHTYTVTHIAPHTRAKKRYCPVLRPGAARRSAA